MIKWATSQSQTHKVENKKMEFLTKFNKYDHIAVKVIPPKIKNFSSTGGFQKQKQQVPLLFKSKSLNYMTMEKQIGKIQFRQTMHTWGRYIKHGNYEF